MNDEWNVPVTRSRTAEIDETEVRRAVELLFHPTEWHLVHRLPSPTGWRFVRSTDEDLIANIIDVSDGSGTYFSLNPVADIPTHGKCLRSSDVAWRQWFLIDVDTVRDDTDVMATENEREASKVVALAVQNYLAERGWPSPVTVSSGNGWQLLYGVDLVADSDTQAILQKCLKSLGKLFDCDAAKIDRSTHDAKRVTKMPGTWVRKGPNTPDRPHRLATILHAPPTVEIVAIQLLRELAGEPQKGDTPQPTPYRHDEWTVRIGNGVGDAAYLNKALQNELAALTLAPMGNRNIALNKAAFSLSQLFEAGLNQSETERQLRDTAKSIGLNDQEIGATIASGFRAGKEKPRSVPERNGHATANGSIAKPELPPAQAADTQWQIVMNGEVVAEGPQAEVLPQPRSTGGTRGRSYEMYTLASLMQTQFPEPVWVVPGILSEGLNILAGKPKMGKSMMALNLGITVAGGGQALGNIQTTAGDVLYISLEDRTRRIQSRARKMLRQDGYGVSGRLTVAPAWPRQGDGGLEMIEWWMGRVARPTLCIIDVWGKFRPAGNPRANQYSQDYEHMAPLKDLMDSHSCCGLALMHTRKGESEDIVDDVSGTLGLAGAADGLIVLQRSRNDNDAKVFVTGRDVPDTELALQFDPETLTWRSMGTADKVLNGKLERAIVDALKNCATPMFATDIAVAVGKKKAADLGESLKRLMAKNIIRRSGNAYSYPGEQVDQDGPTETDLIAISSLSPLTR